MSVTILKGKVIDAISDDSIDDGIVAFDGERIIYSGDASNFKIPDNAVVIEGDTILPGFIDCHAHLTGEENAGEFKDRAPFADQLLGAAYQAGRHLYRRNSGRRGPF